jgi:glycosyltransferase involved in cell wall biosynthesis
MGPRNLEVVGMTEKVRKRLAWCTPFTPASAIGQFSAQVVNALQAPGWQVDLYYPAKAGGRTWPVTGSELGADAASVLAGYDAVVYNIGDNPVNHEAFVAVLRKVPGLVVLHDVSLFHLLVPYLVSGPEHEVLEEMERWYRDAGVALVTEMRADLETVLARPEILDQFPMLELALSNAHGVVTHSHYAAELVRRRYAGDVWTLPLPRTIGHGHDDVALPAEIDERPIILQAGMPNRNKHIPAVIEAFELAGLADRAQLVVCGYGSIKDYDRLESLVSAKGLGASVHLLGRVDDGTLDALRRRACIATVLRYPFGEAASAVLLDSMAYGIPVVTVAGGHYAEVPDDTVARVPVPPRPGDIAPILRRWVDNPAAARQIGLRAAEYVATEHTPEHYARAIVDVVEELGAFPRRRRLADILSSTLQNLGFEPDSPIFTAVADSASELLSPEPVNARIIYGPSHESDGERRATVG